MPITYSKPNLTGHKVLYKGRRFWVFKVSEELPFRGSEKIDDIVVYDGFYDVVACYCHIYKNSEYEGLFPYGQQDLMVSGKIVRDLVDDVTKTIRRSENH